MKKFMQAMLWTMAFFCMLPVCAQISIPKPPPPVKKTYILSESGGRLNYTISDGKRTAYGMSGEVVEIVWLEPEKVYLFCPGLSETVISVAQDNAGDTVIGDTDNFAKLLQQFNRERRRLKRIIGSGSEIRYEFGAGKTAASKSPVLVGVEKGVLSYIIQDGRRKSFSPPQRIIRRYRPVWNCPAYCRRTGQWQAPLLYSASLPETEKRPSAADDNSFAAFRQWLEKTGWKLLAVDGNSVEAVYYYEK